MPQTLTLKRELGFYIQSTFKGRELIQRVRHKFIIKSRPFGFKSKQRAAEVNQSQTCSYMVGWEPLWLTYRGSIKEKPISKSKNKLQRCFPKICRQLKVIWTHFPRTNIPCLNGYRTWPTGTHIDPLLEVESWWDILWWLITSFKKVSYYFKAIRDHLDQYPNPKKKRAQTWKPKLISRGQMVMKSYLESTNHSKMDSPKC